MAEGSYIRVIDYKSSNKTIKLSNIYYGIQLQLLAYIDAICSGNKSFKPAGILYLKLDDPFLKANKRLSKEEVESTIVKSLRMNGLIINEQNIIELMDNEFNSSKNGISYESSVISLNKDKKDKYTKMPIVSEKEFQNLRGHMRKTLKQIGNEIMSGNIKNEPLYKKGAFSNPCDYCSYVKICMFEKTLGNKVRRVKELKDDEVLEKISNP